MLIITQMNFQNATKMGNNQILNVIASLGMYELVMIT